MNNLGILGGTFDPFHFGHLSIAREALRECLVEKVIFLPTNVQPFKIGSEMAESNHRVEMIKLMVDEYDCFDMSTVEAFDDEISYTYKTLNKLSYQYHNSKLYFIIGTDSLMNLDTWYKSDELLREYSFIVGKRPGFREEEVKRKIAEYENNFSTEVILLKNQPLHVSSTEIKDNLREGKSISHLVPEQIERYIKDNGLYK